MDYIGKVIGKYKVVRLIGQGGMAAVYEGIHEGIGRKAAIKILNAELIAHSGIRERFRNEASIMASMQHPNIVQVFDFIEEPGMLAIIMELLEGQDLNEEIKSRGAFSIEETKRVFTQVLAAFEYAHSQGIVHRDVKPSNIFLNSKNEIKILDFGIAKLFGTGMDKTKTGSQLGTPLYMSPEQVIADKSIDFRSDIYSLGVTLYYVLSGKSPYDESSLSGFDIQTKIVKEEFPALTGNSQMNRIIQKATDKDRGKRYQSCSEFQQDIMTEEEDETPIGVPIPPPMATPARKNLLFIIIPFLLVIAGVFAYSQYIKDSDDDGFPDRTDNCKNIAGSNNGCPDADNDGVLDYDDKCSSTFGDPAHFGCPDSDGDGVYDNEDGCITEYGPAENAGCPWPDRDNDGVLDKNDSCPDEYGDPSNDGCRKVSYQVVCPNCNNTTYESKMNNYWNCSSCQESFYGCKNSRTGFYGIKSSWVSDGACDCEDCSDE
jgi:serine/threonine protein kinase